MESVWSYPRPPRIEPCVRRVRVQAGGVTVAESTRALRVLETSQAPAIYVPPEHVEFGLLRPARGRTLCEWKGAAVYFDVAGSAAAAWSYPSPASGYEALRDFVAFYPQRVEACFLDDERVSPNDGDFYGGWITSDVEGPFKGAVGTSAW